MADHDHDHDAVDARLTAAGERLRTTAPAATTGPTGASGGQSWRPWHAGAAVMVAAAAAVVAFIVFPGSADETIRELPADLPTSDPVTPLETDPPEIDTPTTDAPETTDGPRTTDDPIDMGPAHLIHEAAFDDWDGAGGQCTVLRIDAPLDADEIRMCVTGLQIEVGATAYVRSQEVEWSLRLSGSNAAEGRETRSGTGWFTFDDAPCGPPAHEVPDNRWVMVSHCDGGAALYTLLPATPGDEPAHLAGAADGAAHEAVVVGSLPIDASRTNGSPDHLVALRVAGVGGAPIDCLIVAPGRGSRWFESCLGTNEPQHGGLFFHDGLPYAVEVVDSTRVVPVDPAAVLRTHGCSTPVVDVLDAMADPDGLLGEHPSLMLTGLLCAAAPSPFDNPVVDLSATASFGAVHLRAGPLEGGLVVLGRDGPGLWAVTDTSTSVEVGIWPQSIPPSAWFETDPDLLPPIDVTETLRTEIGDAESVETLAGAIETFLLGLHEPEAGEPPSVRFVPGLPERDAGEGRPLLMAEARYLDDSTSSGIYAIWVAEPYIVYPAAIERAYLTYRCSRGVTESEGVLLCL